MAIMPAPLRFHAVVPGCFYSWLDTILAESAFAPYNKGAAMPTEEYVPTTIPIINT